MEDNIKLVACCSQWKSILSVEGCISGIKRLVDRWGAHRSSALPLGMAEMILKC